MSYEHNLTKVAALNPATTTTQRHVEWLGAGQTVGVAKDAHGRLEIFLAGEPITTIYPTLDSSLVHGLWHRENDQPAITANRLLLPTAVHFTEIAAFICTELLRHGADTNLQSAFKQCAALINHSIEALSVNAAALTGLKGELLLLHALTQAHPGPDLGHIITSWHGWRRSTRDFVLGATGIEVKTTTGPTSTHEIQGLHQVELDTSSASEKDLLLVSIGIENVAPAAAATGFTIPDLVNAITSKLTATLPTNEATSLCGELLVHIKDYAGDQGTHYDHTTMSEDPAYSVPFTLVWVRAYDMNDPHIQVLTSDLLGTTPHVLAESVRYTLNLPNQIDGDLNPTSGLPATAKNILSH